MTSTSSLSNDHQLPGLNALRFLAASTVFVHHVEQLKGLFNQPNLWSVTPIFRMGSLAVTFFFVLSGFLISYLLFTEKNETGKIQIKKFYLRRILRIWPLYYTVVFAGLFLLPEFDWFHVPEWSNGNEQGFWLKVALYTFMLPNTVMPLFYPFPAVAQTWSIGVEEQFYLVWPHLFQFNKKIIYAFLSVIAIMMCAREAFVLLNDANPNGIYPYLWHFADDLKFGSMAIGAIGAWLITYDKRRALNFLYSPVVLIAATALMLWRVCIMQFMFAEQELFSIGFLIIILNVATNPRSLFKLRYRWMNAVGKISFGLYMYHIAVITFVIHLALKLMSLEYLSRETFSPFVYVTSVCLTLAIAKASYEWLEKPFLKLKR